MEESKWDLFIRRWGFFDDGEGSGPFSAGFVQRFGRMMAEDLQTRTDVSIFAKSGLETGEILGLMSLPYIQRRIQAADMITITGCGNDLIDSVQAYQQTSDASVFTSVSSHCHENFER